MILLRNIDSIAQDRKILTHHYHTNLNLIIRKKDKNKAFI